MNLHAFHYMAWTAPDLGQPKNRSPAKLDSIGAYYDYQMIWKACGRAVSEGGGPVDATS